MAQEAVAIAAELIAPLAPSIAAALESARDEPVARSSQELRAAVRRAHRMLAYVGAQSS